MASVSYQKKLSRQFTRYAAGMVLVFFLSFTILLLVYTLGINRYRNNKCNDLVAASFSRSYDLYTEFLCSPEAQELFLRRLAGEISDNYTAYYYNSFSLTTGMTSGLILSDAEGTILFSNVGDGTPGTHLSYFNRLVQQNLTTPSQIHSSVYHLLGDSGKYVLAVPLLQNDGTPAGAAAIYIDGSTWESEMRQNQFDGVITDGNGHIIAASNRVWLSGINRYQPESGISEKYSISVSHLQKQDVYIYTFVQNLGVWSYYAIAAVALACLLVALLLSGQTFARRIADLNSRSLETLHRELTAIQENGRHRLELHTGDEFEDISDHINTLLDHLRSLNDRNLELAQLNNQMERLQLEAQFDPHFLYNTLESIRYAIRLGDRNVDTVILKLTALLRYSISQPDGPVVLRDDLRHMQDYLDIIQYRFQSRFHYEISIPESCLDHLCPKLILQPLVENSVKYGMQQRSVLTVRICGWKDEDFLYLEVSDDGPGIDPALLSEMQTLIGSNADQRSPHYGLRNIARRLRLQFGAGSSMELHSVQGQGTTVLLRVSHMEVIK